MAKKNIVFDIGNVLVDYGIKDFLINKGYDGMMIKRILKATVMSPYWEQFERGVLTEDQVLKAFSSLDPEIEDEIVRSLSRIDGMLTIRDYAIDLVKKLKAAGYGVYYLSNYSKKAHDECHDSLAFAEYTDGGILSFQVKMIKPEPEIYKCFLDKYNLSAEDCIFVDDTEKNVITARELGFEGIVFESYDQLLEKFAELGIEC